MVLVHREPRKKYNSEPSIRDVPLYLVTTGPAKNIWTMSTMSKRELIELMPVFDKEETIVNLLVELQEKTYQATTVSLGKLTTMVKDKKVLLS